MTCQTLESSRESTFAMVKPDAVPGHAGEIVAAAEREGFSVAAAALVRLSRTQAEEFYSEHRERNFFE